MTLSRSLRNFLLAGTDRSGAVDAAVREVFARYPKAPAQ